MKQFSKKSLLAQLNIQDASAAKSTTISKKSLHQIKGGSSDIVIEDIIL